MTPTLLGSIHLIQQPPKALSHLCLATDGLFLVQTSVFVENP